MTLRDDTMLSYVECDLPPGITIAEYRRGRVARARNERCHRRRRARALLRHLTQRCERGLSARERTP